MDKGATRTTKGEQTTERILDAAESLFAERGYEAASLREIARRAGIQQPGLYNHFPSKLDLYAAVLDRALMPMAEAMQSCMREDGPWEALSKLPAVMTDLLLAHPQMAALFQQALQSGASAGEELMRGWLHRLLEQGMETVQRATGEDVDRADLALAVIAMFNVSVGYFLSQRALDSLGVGDLRDPANVARHKALFQGIALSIGRAGA